MKQRDPSGTKVASDEMELFARTYGTPVRLQARRVNGVYETWTEFEAPVHWRRVAAAESGTTRSGRTNARRGRRRGTFMAGPPRFPSILIPLSRIVA